MYDQYDTDTDKTLMDMERLMKSQVYTISSLEVCIESAGEAPMPGCNLNKLQSSFNEITLTLAWVFSCGLAAHFRGTLGGLLLLLFFALV